MPNSDTEEIEIPNAIVIDPNIEPSNLSEQTYQEIKTLNDNFTLFNEYILNKDEQEILEKTKQEEQKILLENENNLKIVELEQAEIDFRNNLLDSISDLNLNVTNLSSQTFEVSNNHFSNLSSINSYLEVSSQPKPITEEEQANLHISNLSDLGIVVIVYVGVPVFILWKMFSKLLYQLI